MISDRELEEEIATVELRIGQRTMDILADSRKISTTLQHALTSPAALALAAGAGFILGRITLGSPGRIGNSTSWLSLSETVKGVVGMIRAPTLVWLTRLFRSRDGSKD